MSLALRAGGTEGYYAPSEQPWAANWDAGSHPDAAVCQNWVFLPLWSGIWGKESSLLGRGLSLPCARAASAAAGRDAQGREEKKVKKKMLAVSKNHKNERADWANSCRSGMSQEWSHSPNPLVHGVVSWHGRVPW